MDFLSLEWFSVIVGTVSLYWLAPANARQPLLVVLTLLFLAVASIESAAILVVFALATYSLTNVEHVSRMRAILASLLVLATLSYFKLRFFNAGGRAGDIIANVAIPLGLSYYAFRCLHFVLERYRNTITQPSMKDYFGYLFYLPTIVVGPINRFQEYYAQAAQIEWRADQLSGGLERILFGYFKVAVLGYFLINGILGDAIAGIEPDNEALALYLSILQDGFILYFLFSGFSDIAIGFSLLLGIRVMENFNWPYLQKNISDFWRGWHISLTSWVRDYVYFPVLGASRNPYLATLATFTAIGLWHEISLRYITWGLYHGIGVMVWRRFQVIKRKVRPSWCSLPIPAMVFSALSILVTVHFVMFGLVIVNQEDFSAVLYVYSTVLFFWGDDVSYL